MPLLAEVRVYVEELYVNVGGSKTTVRLSQVRRTQVQEVMKSGCLPRNETFLFLLMETKHDSKLVEREHYRLIWDLKAGC